MDFFEVELSFIFDLCGVMYMLECGILEWWLIFGKIYILIIYV